MTMSFLCFWFTKEQPLVSRVPIDVRRRQLKRLKVGWGSTFACSAYNLGVDKPPRKSVNMRVNMSRKPFMSLGWNLLP